MRPRATRRTDWAQLGMGVCVLVLPPLALGAALYSMLEPADSGAMRSGETDAVLPDNGPLAAQQPAGPSASADGRAPVQVVTQGMLPVPPAAPAVPAAAINPPVSYAATEGAATPASTPSPPAAAAAHKRSIRRNQRQPQQQDVIKTWLQQIGLLPPYR